ncbi:MAG: DUF3034 family protein [Steroidobacteraceae bacterium]
MRRNDLGWISRAILCLPLLCAAGAGHAQELLLPDRGKLLLTGGFSDVEGSGGGGLTSWALTSGYGSDRSWGANAHYTRVDVNDFELDTYGVAASFLDRFELSLARQDFEVTGTALQGVEVSQDVIGVKLRLVGDAVYDQDRWLPQIALGAQFKRHRGIENAGPLTDVRQLGADDEDGVDYLLSATKIYLGQSLLLNATVRVTEANQFGLLGFGNAGGDGYEPQFEGSVGYLLRRSLAIGAEYRTKPDNLAGTVDAEEDAWDLFIAWAPTKHVSVLGAWVNLGSILGPATGEDRDQQGAYLSVQVGF